MKSEIKIMTDLIDAQQKICIAEGRLKEVEDRLGDLMQCYENDKWLYNHLHNMREKIRETMRLI